jgi:hypothetical protein
LPKQIGDVRGARPANVFLADNEDGRAGLRQFLFLLGGGRDLYIHQIFQADGGEIGCGWLLSLDHHGSRKTASDKEMDAKDLAAAPSPADSRAAGIAQFEIYGDGCVHELLIGQIGQEQ